ncbi:MAG: transposase, partial [Bacteriovoracaceae bacterium]|nr:transposase [Bacteriovoracaceae bacterium]
MKDLMNSNDIVITQTRKDLSAKAGLLFFNNLINRLNLEGPLGKILPRKQRNYGLTSKEKFIAGIFAFISGADCIDDLHNLSRESMFSKLTNGGIAPSTMRKFIYSLTLKHTQKLQNYLPQIALAVREKMFPGNRKLILCMDSTPHEQFAEYMEGVEYNYKSIKCLDSQNCFDEYGFCYGWDLRKGATYSSNGTSEMLERILPHVKHKEVYFRADSAYSNLRIYNTLLNNNVKFAICMKENSWGRLIENYEFTMKWNKTKIKFFDSNKCQVAQCLAPIEGLPNRSFLRVVFIRTKKTRAQIEKDKESGKKKIRHYRYYAVVTNIIESEMNNDQIVQFYRKRANVENYIKDLKYGMDFLHFPCRKLRA